MRLSDFDKLIAVILGIFLCGIVVYSCVKLPVSEQVPITARVSAAGTAPSNQTVEPETIDNHAPSEAKSDTKGQADAKPGGQEEDKPAPVPINTADAAQLTGLPGIGESKAEKIIAYRTRNGAFTSLDQLLEVDGIGEKTLENIKPYISLD